MFFISQRTSAELSLVTPPVCCCNCGAKGPLDLVETPMKQVRYFFIFGTELTLTEHFPYCENCKSTAARIRQGWLGKTLTACLLAAAMFLVLVLSADALPKAMSANLFTSAVIAGTLLALAWFYLQEWSRKERTYYQPVSLAGTGNGRNGISSITLKFYNKAYAKAIIAANRELINNRSLKVETRQA